MGVGVAMGSVADGGCGGPGAGVAASVGVLSNGGVAPRGARRIANGSVTSGSDTGSTAAGDATSAVDGVDASGGAAGGGCGLGSGGAAVGVAGVPGLGDAPCVELATRLVQPPSKYRHSYRPDGSGRHPASADSRTSLMLGSVGTRDPASPQ